MKKIFFLIFLFFSFSLSKLYSQSCDTRQWLRVAGGKVGYVIYFENYGNSNCNVIWEVMAKDKELQINRAPYIKRYENGKINIELENKAYVYTESEGLIIKNYKSSVYTEEHYFNNIKETKSNFVSGDAQNVKKEIFSGSIDDLLNYGLNEARKSMAGYNLDSLEISKKRLPLILYNAKISNKKYILKEIKEYSSKIKLSEKEADNLINIKMFAEQGGFYDEEILIMNILISKGPKGSIRFYTKFRADSYRRAKKYTLAINDYKKLLTLDDDSDNKSIYYFYISECYELLGDSKNAAIYKKMEENIDNENINTRKALEAESNINIKKFCIGTSQNKYEITISEGGSMEVIYKLFNTQGVLLKTMNGNWSIQDEGVYGAAYKLKLTWGGVNSKMPPLVFLCQYDAYGNIQGIIDSQNITWEKCN